MTNLQASLGLSQIKNIDWIVLDVQGKDLDIIKSLGKPGEHNTEMHAIMFEYGLEETFSPEVECFARNLDLRINKKEIALIVGNGVNSYDAGEVWHLLYYRNSIEVTRLEINDLNFINLHQFSKSRFIFL